MRDHFVYIFFSFFFLSSPPLSLPSSLFCPAPYIALTYVLTCQSSGPIKSASGTWVEGRLHGQALVEFHNGSRYDGSLLRQQYELPSHASGEWVNGIRCGHGELVLDNNDLYIGAWDNDMQHGYGDPAY